MVGNIHGKFVVVGETLGSIEEYIPQEDDTVYEEDGKLYAAVNGTVGVDPLRRTIAIERAKKQSRPLVKKGDIVIAQVFMGRKFTVGTKIYKVNKKVIVDANMMGNIHISNVSKQYIENVGDAFKRSDWVRAKIIGTGVEYEMSTVGSDLGVIKADCPICGTVMRNSGRNMLQCPFCGKREQRKVSYDYGNVEEQAEY